MRRREWLTTTGAGRAAAVAEPPPGTIEETLNRIETLISPEALAILVATPEEGLIEFEIGFNRIMALRWRSAAGKDPPWLVRVLEVRHVQPINGAAYLLTSLWRRRKGLPLDPDRQLLVLHERRRQLAETIERTQSEQRARGVITRDLGRQSIVLDQDPIYFRNGTTEVEAAQKSSLDGVANLLRTTPSIVLVEAQGHAAVGESHAASLSLSRARVLVATLVRLGVPSTRLSAHGLGSRFPIPEPEICPAGTDWWHKVDRGNGPECFDRDQIRPAPARDRRAELVILRRELWRP
jgi:outer membrane protein OmpA-like peptidoglycan-associated protein